MRAVGRTDAVCQEHKANIESIVMILVSQGSCRSIGYAEVESEKEP